MVALLIALSPLRSDEENYHNEKVITVCPYCAAGCKLRLVVEEENPACRSGNGQNNRGPCA
ncbi:hypothetical protein DMH27_06535 [Raoultella planticola]|nr:hypothetical protein [Raoultella planticola]